MDERKQFSKWKNLVISEEMKWSGKDFKQVYIIQTLKDKRNEKWAYEEKMEWRPCIDLIRIFFSSPSWKLIERRVLERPKCLRTEKAEEAAAETWLSFWEQKDGQRNGRESPLCVCRGDTLRSRRVPDRWQGPGLWEKRARPSAEGCMCVWLFSTVWHVKVCIFHFGKNVID